ncbi:uncharacterized protein LOC143360508 [Halictus rubicundus]|uniref:uncharacterized protein LOC143360508 n=1 Tax=Halictus rubicundus TaxID=77578 RepID=UPI0040362124
MHSMISVPAWIRGIQTRKHFRLLHQSAITIQRQWRGYCVRIFADRYLVERVHRMWQDYYNRMATRIQAIWRGYWVRKTVLNIPAMRRWLKNVYEKNGETVENMNRFKQNEIKNREHRLELESMQWVLFILFKLHHLLRTKQRPGVVTRIDKNSFTFIEEMLKCFEYKKYTGRNVVCCRDCDIDPKKSSIFRGTHYERCEKAIREIERDLKIGAVSVFRSFPYEKQERMQRKENRRRQEASLHQQCEVVPEAEKKRAGKKERRESQRKEDLEDPCRMEDLYDKIKNMDCQLDRFQLRCPVHAAVLASQTTG